MKEERHGALSLQNQARTQAKTNQIQAEDYKRVAVYLSYFAAERFVFKTFSQFPPTCFLTSHGFFWFSCGLRSFDICRAHLPVDLLF